VKNKLYLVLLTKNMHQIKMMKNILEYLFSFNRCAIS